MQTTSNCISLHALENVSHFWLLLIGLLFIGLIQWSIGPREVQAQQLQELDVTRLEQVNELPLVLTEFPKSAYLVFDSSIPDLQFESNWIIRKNLSEPNRGRYILVVDTVRQVLRVSSPARYRTREILIPRLQNRQTVYYKVEPIITTRLGQIHQLYEDGVYQEAVNMLNAFVLIDALTDSQRANAYQLFALCFYELGQEDRMKQALGRMLAINPFRTPDVVGNPAIVQDFIEQYQDSVRSQPPDMPEEVDGTLINNNVLLNWKANSEIDFAHYRVYRMLNQEDEGIWEVLAEPLTPMYLDESTLPFGDYSYRISAVDDYQPAQESILSEKVDVTVIPSLAERTEVIVEDGSPIKNVSLHQINDSLLTLSYTLQHSLKRTYNVSFTVSDDNGKTFSILPHSATGDIGSGVPDGLRRQINWPVLKDYSEGLLEQQYIIAMQAEPLPLNDQISFEVEPDSLVEFYSLRSEGDSLITIGYRLQDLDKTRYDVDLAIKHQKGQYALLFPQVLDGNIGSRIKGGRDNVIQWRILETYPQGLEDEIIVQLRVEARRRTWPPWYLTTTAAVLIGGTSILLFQPDKQEAPVAEKPVPRPN